MTTTERMTSEERQRARSGLLESVNAAEAEYFAAREELEDLQRRAAAAAQRADSLRSALQKRQEDLKGFLGPLP